MIKRFCLYGFLKNFDFSEPFIILFYLSLGLNFFQIGILTAFLNVLINLMEIPSGSFADLYGKKTAMPVSLISYVISFVFFSLASSFGFLFPALFFYAVGDAFRTGTHKAIIFEWLKQNNRLSEKTYVYGYTRSWSKYGSAFSVIIAAFIVIYMQNYRYVFILSIIPALLGVWNMAMYPKSLNTKPAVSVCSFKEVMAHTFRVIKKSFTSRQIRTLIIQNMSFSGSFSVSEKYLQPLLKLQAAALASSLLLSENLGTPILIGCVYFLLNILSAFSSRNAYRFVKRARSDERAVFLLLVMGCVLLLISGFGFYTELYGITIASYLILSILMNLWVPINIAQYDNYSDSSDQAGILSIASQAKTLAVAALAPLCGFLADSLGIYSIGLFLSIILFATAILHHLELPKIFCYNIRHANKLRKYKE
ncbi:MULTISPECIES: MFS transporter [unclassified Treponema]|uniref:MFS transporter n=1 Tax=unclassified Treponema TaxID=2638727 RepID=UPI0020A52D26|nr:MULTISPECIES: MFS transporter [unclassified Treponema]UTC66656.1 MFS transporter [Treponema sp. OMZ 789]UTC69388.1 MFS transporter [Treponema sp. OMZ 790]UTC72103.1 MFS transporter [Treponema sp. OMZ 791]